MRSGSLNIPPQGGRPSAMMGAMPGARFDGPRSPPSESLLPFSNSLKGKPPVGLNRLPSETSGSTGGIPTWSAILY